MQAILFDVTRCRGCERCVDACVEANGGDAQAAARDRATTRDGLSADRLLTLRPVDEGRFARLSCMHCVEPSCVAACLVGGLRKTAQGAVVYDPDKCIGCRYCMLACPFHIPRYEWDKTVPLVRKCNMCVDRQQKGQLPACVEACPEHALVFGERELLLKEARSRIESNPDRYINHIWGEHEYGGTCVIYISDVDLGGLGWSKRIHAGIPMLTDPLIEKTPIIGLSVATGLLAVNWIIRRRMRLSKQQVTENNDSLNNEPGEKS